MSDPKKKVVKKKTKEYTEEIQNKSGENIPEKVNNTTDNSDKRKNKTTKQRVLRAVAIILCVILVFCIIAVAVIYFVFKHYYDKTNYIPDDKTSITTMASSELESVIAEAKHDDIIAPIESSVYEEMSKTAEVTVAEENESSVMESIVESISSIEGESVYESIKESAVESIASSIAAENPDLIVEEILSSIAEDESIMESVESEAKEEASSEIESKASSAYEEKESSIASSAAEEVKESISDAAEETAESIASSLESEMESQSKELESQEVASSDNVYNLLLIGVDVNNYSDTIMLVSINEAKHTVYMTSILRDMSVTIPQFGMFKLNNAFRFGGAPLLISTIENNLKVKIDNYAFVSFEGMITIFDAAGGLELDISEGEMKNANAYIAEMGVWHGVDAEANYFKQGGYQHMTGAQILAYCRSRYVGFGDVDRTARQRNAISKLYSKLRGFGIGELNDYLNTVLPIISHNIDSGKVMSLLMNAGSYINYDLVGLRVPYDGTYHISKADDYMIMSDVAANAAYLKATIY